MKKKLFNIAISTLLLTSTAYAADYNIDPDHSSISFKVRHLGISSVKGKLLKFEGTFSYDPENITASATNAKIKTASIDTANAKRDDHLKNNDFLNAPKFPEILFKSKEVKDSNDEGFKLVGDLTIRDVTKEVVLDVTTTGTVTDPWGNERAGFNANTKVNRKDFGIVWNKTLDNGGLVVGEEVQIELEIEGIKKKA